MDFWGADLYLRQLSYILWTKAKENQKHVQKVTDQTIGKSFHLILKKNDVLLSVFLNKN